MLQLLPKESGIQTADPPGIHEQLPQEAYCAGVKERWGGSKRDCQAHASFDKHSVAEGCGLPGNFWFDLLHVLAKEDAGAESALEA